MKPSQWVRQQFEALIPASKDEIAKGLGVAVEDLSPEVEACAILQAQNFATWRLLDKLFPGGVPNG